MAISREKIAAYKQVDVQSRVASASPHGLIAMLFEAIVHQLRLALAAISSSDIGAMNNALQKATELLGGLRESLNMQLDTDLPHRLDSLYEYMQRRLISARLADAEPKITEILELVIIIQSGWKEIETTPAP